MFRSLLRLLSRRANDVLQQTFPMSVRRDICVAMELTAAGTVQDSHLIPDRDGFIRLDTDVSLAIPDSSVCSGLFRAEQLFRLQNYPKSSDFTNFGADSER